MIRFTLAQLDDKSKSRPQGYRAEILSNAQEIGDGLYELEDSVFVTLAQKYREPNFFDKVASASDAAITALLHPDMRSKEEIKHVTDICRVCPFLIEDGFRCSVCGCSLYLKPVAKSWHCPQGKW